jgi:hypothetical protein
VFAIVFTMSATVWMELLAKPGALARAQSGLVSIPRPLRAEPTPHRAHRLPAAAGAGECGGMFLTSSHGLKPCDSRFTLPLPCGGISGALRACGRPTLTGRPVPDRLRLRDSPVEDCSTPACTGVLEHGKRYSGAPHVEQVRVSRGVHMTDQERREHIPVGFRPAAAAVGPLAEGLLGDRAADARLG